MENTQIQEKKPKAYINPYLGGVLLGLVLLSAYYFAGEGLGASGAFKNGVAVVVGAVNSNPTSHGYFIDTFHKLKDPRKLWIVLEVFGVLVGGFISGIISRRNKLKVEHSPKITSKKRLILALSGGILFGFGSQFARGCTSGAALSGMATISVAGFLTMICIFGTGYIFAYLFRKNWI